MHFSMSPLSFLRLTVIMFINSHVLHISARWRCTDIWTWSTGNMCKDVKVCWELTSWMPPSKRKMWLWYKPTLLAVSCAMAPSWWCLTKRARERLVTATNSTLTLKWGELVACWPGITPVDISCRAEIVQWIAENLQPFKIVSNQEREAWVLLTFPRYSVVLQY